MKEIIQILKYKLVSLNLFLVIVFAFAMFYLEYFAPVFFILTSNLYDILGYHFSLIRRTKVMPEKIIIRSYRINQIMFDITLLILLAVVFSPVAAFAGAVLKLFGVQDVLYYIFLRMEFPEKWTWLKWTPLGIINKSLSLKIVILQSVVGIIFSLILLMNFQK
ncbi:MAG TPA: hypothetical protein VK870_05685 [Ignavibacteriaceae bacterium]|nr:hypothetical protein [Ignavibacteriaceae bacterium]